jgi:hypothetical protein
MFTTSRKWLRVCALLAIVLTIGMLGVQIAGPCQDECASDEVACSCVCHDTAVVLEPSALLLQAHFAGTIEDEPRVELCPIPADIFRPPTA